MNQLEFVQARLARERALMAQLLTELCTRVQLEMKPACLKGLTVQDARISWGGGFCPLDKAPRSSASKDGA